MNEIRVMVEMPTFQCHKQVGALKIQSIVYIRFKRFAGEDRAMDNGATLYVDGEEYAPITVDQAYLDKHSPQVGGYYVVYEDGYKSFSPAKAFESGYTLIDGAANELNSTARFIAEVHNEVERARAKFPNSQFSMIALMEEVGELSKAMLDEGINNVRNEALQVACMAVRVAVDGDPTTNVFREAKGLEKTAP